MIGITAAYGGRKLLSSSVVGAPARCTVGLGDVKPVVTTLRTVWAAVTSTAAQVPPRRALGILAAIVILVAVAVLVPLPSAVQLRDWATAAGPWFPLVFFAAHTVMTVFPFPRTAFTLAAGLLFGPLLGVEHRRGGQHRQRGPGRAAGAGGRVAAQPAHPAPAGRVTGQQAARTRLGDGAVDADDPGGAVRGAQLRGGRVRGADAALHGGDADRGVPRNRGGGHPRRCPHRQRQSPAAAGVGLHREHRRGRTDL